MKPLSVLRRRRQHRVELALSDDDMHLAADSGVGEQLLHVEEAARLAVDRVLGPAVAEHRSRDRHLGVVDRQCPVGVVDRQHHLGTTERWPTRGAGKDDVFHLAAAQRLRALLTHDPGQCVNNVGLPRPVRSDDTRDAWFKAQRRRRGERLEAAEREGLEIHRRLLLRCRPLCRRTPYAERGPSQNKGGADRCNLRSTGNDWPTTQHGGECLCQSELRTSGLSLPSRADASASDARTGRVRQSGTEVAGVRRALARNAQGAERQA